MLKRSNGVWKTLNGLKLKVEKVGTKAPVAGLIWSVPTPVTLKRDGTAVPEPSAVPLKVSIVVSETSRAP